MVKAVNPSMMMLSDSIVEDLLVVDEDGLPVVCETLLPRVAKPSLLYCAS